ncbi:peptidylprolyl isomerase [Maricaulis sp. D1M11]|uniref:peptidylprolyl isomerase n=1 Tax=Maricaulis sp. D1M11 TaxID=3076117 RepID=UPI0039B51C40
MISRLSLAACLTLALSATACARDAQTETAPQDASPTEVAAPAETAPAFEFSEAAWRDLDPENTLYLSTNYGPVVIELAPEFAPRHVERIKTLADQNFYDFLIWHRVIEDFMAQGGGHRSNPNHRTDLPPVPAEFTVRRGGELQVSELMMRPVRPRGRDQAPAGFWQGFPAGTRPLAAAALMGDGRVDSWLLHCTGAAAMARTADPNSAGSQFYITLGDAEHLNADYTVWGRVRHGIEAIESLNVGVLYDDPEFTPDVIRSIRMENAVPEAERLRVQVVDTNSAEFSAYLDTLRDADGVLPDVCDIDVPTRILN